MKTRRWIRGAAACVVVPAGWVLAIVWEEREAPRDFPRASLTIRDRRREVCWRWEDRLRGWAPMACEGGDSRAASGVRPWEVPLPPGAKTALATSVEVEGRRGEVRLVACDLAPRQVSAWYRTRWEGLEGWRFERVNDETCWASRSEGEVGIVGLEAGGQAYIGITVLWSGAD